MKNIYLVILLFVFAISAVAQDYKLEDKKYDKKNKKPQWEYEITYPQIKNPEHETYRIFNKLTKDMASAQRDTFLFRIRDWEVNEYNKDMGSYYSINDTVMYHDSKLISVQYYEEAYFAGSAHPSHDAFTFNYDIDRQKEILLKDLFTGNYLNVISDYCIKEIMKTKQGFDSTLTQPDEWVTEGAGPKEENFKVFSFTSEGILFTFPQYQVGSYAEGPYEVYVPYAVFKDYAKKDGHISRMIK